MVSKEEAIEILLLLELKQHSSLLDCGYMITSFFTKGLYKRLSTTSTPPSSFENQKQWVMMISKDEKIIQILLRPR